MQELDFNLEAKSLKYAEQIKKLQEIKAKVDARLATEKQQIDLARKVGVIVVSEFQGKAFKYEALEKILDEKLVDDFERDFFSLSPLPADDSRRPKKRGRKKRGE